MQTKVWLESFLTRPWYEMAKEFDLEFELKDSGSGWQSGSKVMRQVENSFWNVFFCLEGTSDAEISESGLHSQREQNIWPDVLKNLRHDCHKGTEF